MKLRNPTDKYLFAENADGLASMFHPSGYKVPDEEPILIFRAKDIGTLAAISAYLDMLCEQEPSETIRDHLISMVAVSDAVYAYQSNNNVDTVTCSLKAHRGAVDGLRSDFKASYSAALDHLDKVYGVVI